MKYQIVVAIALSGLIACQDSRNDVPAIDDTPKTEDPQGKTDEELAQERPPLIYRQDINLMDEEKQVSYQTNAFAFELLKTIFRSENAEKNIFLSPLSASLALSMLDNGADGETHAEIQAALGFGGFAREAQNSYWQKMIKAMTTLDTWSAFESANSIWIRQNFPVLDAFKEVNRQYFAAEIRNEDFDNKEATLKLINDWVSLKTHDKIKDILDDYSGNDVMFLINTLYFKGYWGIGFDEKNTVDEKFYNHDGRTPLVPMMTTSASMKYAKRDSFSILEIPFGNHAFSMVIVLPDKDVTLSSISEGLNNDLWENYEAEYSNVHLKLPRFKVEYERTLNKDLKLLGMKYMFHEDSCNLKLINPDWRLYVSLVKQKTFVEVNETGVEAAAATIVIVTNESDGPSLPNEDFTVDRPFLFFIKEYSTKNIFFAGVVKNLK